MLSVAWLITSMYTLSWYDLIAWMPLAVLAASKLDRIMVLRITRCRWPTCLAAQSSRPGAGLHRHRIRDTVSPIIQFAVLVAVVIWWKKPDREELFPLRNKTEPTTPPPLLATGRSRTAAR